MLSLIADVEPEASAALSSSLVALVCDAHEASRAAARLVCTSAQEIFSLFVVVTCVVHLSSISSNSTNNKHQPGAEWEQQSKQAARWAAALFSAETPLFDRVEQLEGILPLAQVASTALPFPTHPLQPPPPPCPSSI